LAGKSASVRMKQKYTRARPLRLASKKRISNLIRAGFFLFSILYFVSAGAVITRLDNLAVSDVKVFGNSGVPTEAILSSALGAVQDSGFNIFNKESIVLYPVSKVERAIKDDLKRIASVKVERIAPSAILIDVVERTPVGLWCKAGDVDVPESCYFFDHDGYIFDSSPDFSGNAYIKFWGGVGETDNPIGQNFTDSETFKEIQFFLNTLDNEKISVSDYRFLGEGDYVIESVSGSEIRLSNRVDMRQSLENLLVFLDGASGGDERTYLDAYEYIDLRFGNKVFYRLRGD
jgi:cell division septal protein FtsQ